MQTVRKKTSFVILMVLAWVLIFPMSGLADGGEEEGGMVQEVDGYSVVLDFTYPVAKGENAVHVSVKDLQGQPVSEMTVKILLVKGQSTSKGEDVHGETEQAAPEPMAGMDSEPAPGHTEEMEMILLEAGHEEGEFEGVITVPSGGKWTLQVHLTSQGETLEIYFPFEVDTPLTGAGVLAGFIVINAAVLFVAAAKKPRPLSKM